MAIDLPAERTKNKRPHIVPLSEPAADILHQQPQRVNSNGDLRDGFASVNADFRLVALQRTLGRAYYQGPRQATYHYTPPIFAGQCRR